MTDGSVAIGATVRAGLSGLLPSLRACWAALELAKQVSNATIVFIVCDRGDRYLSTGVFPA